MKKTIIITVFILGFLSNVIGQDIKYIANPNLDKFVGTWTAKKGDTILIITLNKFQTISHNVKMDIIQGSHMFKIGNKIYDQSKEITLKFGTNLAEDYSEYRNRLYIVFLDHAKKKGGKVTLYFDPNNPTQLKWSLLNGEGLRLHKPGESNFDPKFTVPTYLTFTKDQ